ncbi:MAG: winged helix DNA-binding domain-containing protein [Anaerolineae bacterium]
MLQSHIGLQRLRSQHITQDKFETPEDVVGWMGAMQAQDYLQAVWAVGVRTQRGLLADVEQALETGRIIRTWPMRGTIHFILPQEARWRLMLSAARMIAADQRRLHQLDLSVEIMAQCEAVFRAALEGGKRLTRSQMLDLLEHNGISAAKQRGYHILWYTAQIGVICLGPMEDKQQTFTLLDNWVQEDLTREEALGTLARRYFTSHGPATVHDLAWWAGITVTDARSGLEMVKTEFITEEVDGKTYWMHASANGINPDDDSARVMLLPGFDEYFLGYKDRGAIISDEHMQKVVPGNNGVFKPMLVVDGEVVGLWQRTVKKKAVEVTLLPFNTLGAYEAEAVEAAQGYAAFHGLPLVVKGASRPG